MKKTGCLLLGIACAGSASAIIIDFEGGAPAGGTTSINSGYHNEDGFNLYIDHGHHISSSYYPWDYNNHGVQNGTDWLLLDNSGPNVLTADDNSLFSIQSVDIMDWSGGTSVGSIIGTFADNSTILASVNYTPSLSTYTFSPAWSGLKSVNFTGTTYKSLDNIVVNQIPEPASAGLIALVSGGFVFIRRRMIL